MPFSDPIVAGDVLVRSAIKSPDYVAGVSGWAVNGDGSIEAADLTIRGAGGQKIRGYVEPVNNLPVLDFQPADPTAAAGSLYTFPDGVGYEVLGISSPVLYQPGATGESKIELRSGQSADPTTTITLLADAVVIGAPAGPPALLDGGSGVSYMRAQTGVRSISAAGSPSATVVQTFPTAFPPGTTPAVMCNINSGAGSTARCRVRAISITTTQFTIFIESNDAATNLAWTAVAVGWLAVG